MYVSHKDAQVSQDELNMEGGIDPKKPEDIDRSKRADLITLPGGSKSDSKTKRMCMHPKVGMYITERMCCAYWDSTRVKRPWKT